MDTDTNRLLASEARTVRIEAKLDELLLHIRVQNGRLAKGEEWEDEHAKLHHAQALVEAHELGMTEGARVLRKRDYALLGVLFTVMTSLSGIALKFFAG